MLAPGLTANAVVPRNRFPEMVYRSQFAGAFNRYRETFAVTQDGQQIRLFGPSLDTFPGNPLLRIPQSRLGPSPGNRFR
jgi:hypothetical protein